MKQISIQITPETARQMAGLASRWGLAPQRHNTSVIERSVATVHLLEIGYDEYTRRMTQMTESSAPVGPAVTESEIPEMLRSWSAGLRSGYSLGQVIKRSADDFDHDGLIEAAGLISDGIRPLQALMRWSQTDGSRDAQLIIATVELQMEAGGNLADKLDFLAQVL